MKGCPRASSESLCPEATAIRATQPAGSDGHAPGSKRSQQLRNCRSHDAVRSSRSRLSASIAVTAMLFILAVPSLALPHGRHGHGHGPRQPTGAHSHRMGNNGNHRQPSHNSNKQVRPPQEPPGREHLQEWFRNHQNMTFEQQERALRRQPGFRQLSPAQRRRILHGLRMLDAQPPAVRARIMARNEAFERLSPERQQEVRAAAQAFRHMPEYRKRKLGRAFHILRTLPPDERTAILNSARFRSEYSPRERHILGSLLSIEPWQPPAPAPAPPPPQPPPRP